MEKWERNINIEEMEFTKPEVNVQIWNIPEHCKTIKLGWKLAAVAGEVLECNLYDGGNGQGLFIKAKVKLDVNQPIKRGTNIGSKEDGIAWVDFKYEKLPTLCYFCGRLGHDEGTCEEAEKKEDGSKQKSKGLGTWIRADTMGIRVSDSRENKGKAGEGTRSEEDGRNQQKESQQRLLDRLANLTVADNRQSKPNTSNNKALTQVQTNKKDNGKENEKKGKGMEEDKETQTSQSPRQQNKEETKEGEKPKEEARNEEISIEEENTTEVQGKEERKRWKRRARESENNNSNKEGKMNTDAKRKLEAEVPMEIEEEEKETKKHRSNPPTAVVAKQPCQDQ
ncbi:uncharacterized protein DS421_2g37840 [Arachis hypogaea]|nr:uncharacterized protein DS421_2g37840 [Arachis hypogaea]